MSTRSLRSRTRSMRHCSFTNRRRYLFEPLESRVLLSHGSGLGYTFEPVAFLGDPAPGGGVFINDFEPLGINNRGQAAFVADVSECASGFCEGMFVGKAGNLSQTQRSGQAAPGGGTLLFGSFGNQAINDRGDLVENWYLDPFTLSDINIGIYRYSANTQAVTPVVVPGITPAPGGGVFQSGIIPDINNRGDIVFWGIVPTEDGIHIDGEPYRGLGAGVFRADRDGAIVSVVSPGDPAPEGGTFDFARMSAMNDAGDIAFFGHIAGDECLTWRPQSAFVHCLNTNLYVKEASSGETRLLVHYGDPAIGGQDFPGDAVMNNRGEIAFEVGDVVAPPVFIDRVGIYLSSGDAVIPVALPGDPVPGGGHIVNVGIFIGDHDLNNRGDVAFPATLDSDANADGVADTGAYVWSRRGRGGPSLHLVARSGTVIPGLGTIAHINSPAFVGAAFGQVAKINDHGQVLFPATLEDGTGVLLIATPTGKGNASDLVVTAAPATHTSGSSGRASAATGPSATDSRSSRVNSPVTLAQPPAAPATSNPTSSQLLDLAFSDYHGIDEALLNDLAAALLN